MTGAAPGVVLTALAGSLCSAGAVILIRQGLAGGEAYTGYWINLAVGAVSLWAAVLAMGALEAVSLRGVALFALAGLVGTVAGRLLRFLSIQRVGAPVAAAIMNLYPLVSAALAVVFLGERVTGPILAGTVVIVAGTLCLSVGRGRLGVPAGALALPFLSALCFGLVVVLRKLALGEVGPVLGFAINVTAALIVFTAFLLATGQGGAMRARGRSLVIFIAAGVAENAGVFLTVVALSLGTVSVVAPLTSTSPIFVLLLSLVFLRQVDRLSGRIVVGTLLIVLGVALISAR